MGQTAFVNSVILQPAELFVQGHTDHLAQDVLVRGKGMGQAQSVGIRVGVSETGLGSGTGWGTGWGPV